MKEETNKLIISPSMVKSSAKKKVYLWVPASQAFWPSYSWTD